MIDGPEDRIGFSWTLGDIWNSLGTWFVKDIAQFLHSLRIASG
jgi:hypothetical protein